MVLIFRGGSLFSLNRFVFAVPFIFLVVKYYLDGSFNFSSKQILFIFILFLFYWLLFGSYVHIQAFLKYVLISIYLLLFFLIKIRNKKWSRFYLISFISINFIFQFYFFIHFLMSKGSQGWIGQIWNNFTIHFQQYYLIDISKDYQFQYFVKFLSCYFPIL